MGLGFRPCLRLAYQALQVVVLAAVGVAALLVAVSSLPTLVGLKSFIVYSGSMQPAILVGSVVVAGSADPARLQPGDIITFQPPNSATLITHRIIAVLDGSATPAFRTKGDSNGDPDPESIPASRIVGRLLYSVPLAGYLLYFLGTGPGKIALVAVIVFLLLPGLFRSRSLGDVVERTFDWTRWTPRSIQLQMGSTSAMAPVFGGQGSRGRQDRSNPRPRAAEPAGPNLTRLLSRAQAYSSVGNRPMAYELYHEVTESDALNEAAWLGKAANAPTFDAAISCLNVLLALDPENDKACQGLELLQRARTSSADGPLGETGQALAAVLSGDGGQAFAARPAASTELPLEQGTTVPLPGKTTRPIHAEPPPRERATSSVGSVPASPIATPVSKERAEALPPASPAGTPRGKAKATPDAQTRPGAVEVPALPATSPAAARFSREPGVADQRAAEAAPATPVPRPPAPGPHSVSRLLSMAYAHAKVGNRAKAHELYSEVAELDPRNQTAWLGKAANAPSQDAAIAALNVLLALDPDNAKAKRGRAQLEEIRRGGGKETQINARIAEALAGLQPVEAAEQASSRQRFPLRPAAEAGARSTGSADSMGASPPTRLGQATPSPSPMERGTGGEAVPRWRSEHRQRAEAATSNRRTFVAIPVKARSQDKRKGDSGGTMKRVNRREALYALCLVLSACAPAAAPTAAPASKAGSPPESKASPAPAPKVAGTAAAKPPAAPAKAPVSFKGKSITILVPFSAGGVADIRARALAPFLEKVAPGNPTVIVQNMAGAGGIVGDNWVFNVAPKDGSVMDQASALFPNALLSPEQVKFDITKWQWMWAVTSSSPTYIDTKLGIRSAEDLPKATERIFIGDSTTTTGRVMAPRLLLKLLGKDFKFVTGYGSSGDSRAALQRGEIHIAADGLEGYLSAVKPMVDQGMALPLGQDGIALEGKHVRDPRLPDIPLYTEILVKLKGEAAKQTPEYRAMELNARLGALRSIWMYPPGVPSETVATMAAAFEKMFADPEFIRDYEKGTGAKPISLNADQVRQEATFLAELLKKDREATDVLLKLAHEQD